MHLERDGNVWIQIPSRDPVWEFATIQAVIVAFRSGGRIERRQKEREDEKLKQDSHLEGRSLGKERVGKKEKGKTENED